MAGSSIERTIDPVSRFNDLGGFVISQLLGNEFCAFRTRFEIGYTFLNNRSDARKSRVKMPVVVIGASTTALSCLRLIAQAGYPAYAACPSDAWPSKTRYFRACPPRDGSIWHGELGRAGLRLLQALDFERCILIPTADDAALWLAELPDELGERFLTSVSSGTSMKVLQQKSTFSSLVTELGVPSPRSFAIDYECDLLDIPINSTDAFFLKPVDSQSFSRRYGKKAIWVSSYEQALQAWEQASKESLALIAQEFIPGGADDHYFIDGFRDRNGIIRAKTSRRRIRMYPADFGNSSYCVSTSFEFVRPAWESLERILKHTEYRGIFSAEFKLDSRDGLFKILEVNTRPWVYIEFAAVCGMNMCDLYIRDALREDVPTIKDYTVGLGCVNLLADIRNLKQSPMAERPNVLAILLAWLQAFKLIFSWRDPLPVLVFVGIEARNLLRRIISK